MSELMLLLNRWAPLGTAALWRASWQGGAALALAWAACRLWPQLSAGLRGWLWRLAYLKLFVALAWAAPVALPLLPEQPSAISGQPSALQPSAISRQPSAPTSRRESIAPVSAGLTPDALRLTPILLLWMAGAGLLGLRAAREWGASRRLAGAAQLVTDAGVLEAYGALGRRFGLRRLPRLLLSEEAGSPVLAGLCPPALLFPPSLLVACSDGERNAILAHELAHLKRRDLLWAWLPALAQVLFFFHPLVWLTRREWRLAQEIACDEMAVQVTGTPPLAYAEVVLKVAARRPRGWAEPVALGAVGPFQELRQRFLALQQLRPGGITSRRQRLGAYLAALGTALLVPWRVTAQSAPAAPPAAPPAPRSSAPAAPDLRRRELVERSRIEHLQQRLSAMAAQNRLQQLQRLMTLLKQENRVLQARMARQAALLAEQQTREHARQEQLRRQLAELEAQRVTLSQREETQRQLLAAEHAHFLGVMAEQRRLLLQQNALTQRLRREQERLRHSPPPAQPRSPSPPASSP